MSSTAGAGGPAGDAGWLAPRDLAFLLLINLIWGFNIVASKVGVSEIPPVLFTGLRFLVLSVVLAPVLRVLPQQMPMLIVAALLTGALHFGLMFYGLSLADDVSTVAIATQLGVPFATLLSVWLLRERIGWRRKLGIALSFVGILIIGFDPRVVGYLDGLALVVLSTFVGSLGLILIKQLRDVRAMQLQAWIATLSWPVLFLLSALLESGQLVAMRSASWQGWGAVLFTSLAASLVGHSGLYYLIRRYPVTTVSPLTVLAPVFGIFFGVTLLDDHLTVRMLIGGAVTLAGVVIVARRGPRIVDTGT
jgi:O-acetylserine/cysteine efflux transporter